MFKPSRALASLYRNAPLALALSLTLVGTGCSKNKGTNAPDGSGKTQEQIDAERKATAERAEVEGLVGLANRDLAKGRYMSALRRADEALAVNPNNADAFSVRGAAYWRAGDFRKSTEAFEKALELDATNFGAIEGLGRNLQASGDHSRAISLQNTLIAKEAEGFVQTACSEDGACEIGFCNQETKMCLPPMQVAPRLVKLWSHYLLADADEVVKVTDDIFVGVGGDEGQLGVVRAFAGFMRPFAGKGPLIQIEGTKGTSDLMVDTTQGIRHISSTVGGTYGRAVLLELVDESRVDKAFAKAQGWPELGKFIPLGMTEESTLVLIPEVEIKGVKIKNVPAIVMDLSIYDSAVGETPSLVLGRQVMQRFGAITFDNPKGEVILETAAPSGPPAGAIDATLLMLDMHALHVPAVEIGIDGSEHRFWVWLGGIYQAAYAVSSKAYFKSGHRPLEIEPPDDDSFGLRMVTFDSATIGGKSVPGGGGFVFTNTPPDQQLGNVLEATAFELGGYINLVSMKRWKVTYALQSGHVYLEIPNAK